MAETLLNLDVKKELLKKQYCFTELTDEEMRILSTLLTEKRISAGETIVMEGDLVDSVFIIVKGEADVRHVTIQNNAEHIESLASLGPGDSIGLNETGFYSLSGVRTATVVAKTDMIVLRLSVAAFHGFALSYSHVNEIMRNNAKAIADSDSK